MDDDELLAALAAPMPPPYQLLAGARRLAEPSTPAAVASALG